ncbi:MAG TPA: ATP-dependent zinc metalloprotease FtsH [Ktedonobacterales bacterium]|nr:ATP-dependent zinc metalloprotease FtsH [Ktedonobacterales bacterium]
MANFRWTRGWIVLLATLAVVFILSGVALAQRVQPRQTDLSTTLADIRADIAKHHVDTITIDGSTLTLDRGGGQIVQTGIGQDFSLNETLKSSGIPYDNPSVLRVSYAQQGMWATASGPLLSLGLIALMIGGLVFFNRRSQGGANPALSFGKSKARLFTEDKPSVTFSDVEGVDEAKQELQEIVEFLKYPRKFAELGARVPKGVLLAGPPGTGKTLVSRAVAGEAGVPFFSISGSEFVEMFVGVGASRVRDLFEQAKKAAPAIIFVDEIDAVGRQRGSGYGGSHDEREQTLNQMLVEMDGFDPNTNVIVMAATNRADVLDAALLRPGRFDRQITLDRPDARGRAAILRVHARNKPMAEGVDLDLIARQTAGFSGADLQNLLNEAAILTARADEKAIAMRALEEAMDRVLAGPARKSRVISEREKAITAYHEVGHALVAHLLPHVDKVHKVSIVSRGQVGGYTRLVSEEERSLWSKSQFRDFLAFALGGHAAEKLIFGEVTTGASNDIERVTSIARKMVTDYGMSERLGPVRLSRRDNAMPGEQPEYSEETAREIDTEVREIVARAMQTAERLLAEHRDRLVLISERLIEREILEGKEFARLFEAPVPTEGVPQPVAAMSPTAVGHGLPPNMSMNIVNGDGHAADHLSASLDHEAPDDTSAQ